MTETSRGQQRNIPAIPGVLTETSLKLPPNLPIEQWLDVGETLKTIAYGVQFWVGDWLAYGDREYGEDAAQALNRRDRTLANWASACRRVDVSRRRADVDFSHHVEVAKLDPENQVKVLERVATENLSVSATRELVKEVELEELESNGYRVEKVKTITCPHCDGTGEIERM